MKGIVFTVDAIISLIIVGFAVSIILYVNFSSLLIYQPSATETFTILQNLMQTNLGSFSYKYAQYAAQGWNAAAYPWQQSGGGQSLSSSSAYGPQIPGLLFSYAAQSNIYKIIAVGSGVVAFYSGAYLYEVNATYGNVIGGFPVQKPTQLVGSPVIYDNELIYANTSGSADYIGAVSVSNGNALWSRSLGFYPTTQMEIENGYLTFGSGSSIYLLNPFNGSVVSTNALAAPIRTPAYSNGAYVIMTNNTAGQNHLYSYSLSGNYLSLTWSLGLPSGYTTQPAIGSNVIAVGVSNTVGGNYILYIYTLGGNYITGYSANTQIKGISIIGNRVYGQTASSVFYVNPFPNDSVYYTTSSTLPNSENATPSVTPSTTYLLTDNNYFQAYSPELSASLWNVSLPTTSFSRYSGVAIAYGNAYVASGTTLYAFGACKANPSASMIEDLAYMYLNGEGTCASMILSNFYRESDVGLFINNTYAPSVQGAQFNGASSYVQAGIPLLTPNTITIAAWVYVTGGASQWDAVTNTGTTLFSANPSGIYFWPDTNNYGFSYSTSGLANRWSFIAATWNYAAGSGALYINGQQVAAGSSSSPQRRAVTQMTIGSYGGAYYTGSIADVQMYNAQLSAAQINALYQEGVAGAPALAGNVVGWWPLDGNANDYGPNLDTGFPYNVNYNPVGALPPGLSYAYGVSRYSVPLTIGSNGVQRNYNVGVVVWH
jgi:hypothetical protein